MILKPRINGFKVDEFIKKSGFDKFYRLEAIGFSVGIYLLWKICFDVEVVINHKQLIHFRISMKN